MRSPRINFGDSTGAVPIALLVPTLAAAALGYFMFYGRISDVYMGVITLTVTLILFNFINSTAGEEWHIGDAPLGGFNGIPATPAAQLCRATAGAPLDARADLRPAVACLLVCYVLCKVSWRSRFGRVVVAIRENELRAELLGYDVRLYKLAHLHDRRGDGGARRPAVRQLASSSARPCSAWPIAARSSSGSWSAASAR